MPSVYERKAPNVLIKSDEQINHSDQPTPAGPPLAPTDLTGSLTPSMTLKLKWTNNSHGYEQGMIVERSNDGISYTVIQVIDTPRVQSYIDVTIDVDYVFFYRVRAYNSIDYSDYSNIFHWTGQCGYFGCGFFGNGWFGGTH